ncbi:MAG: CotH kinase family protein [Saprospiraceae bacterium]|nr:CotH kinase family protein [Saprospiraceae bacterium]MCB9325845.1 CotH kinase family protein [Lewinellaceae bacterium]
MKRFFLHLVIFNLSIWFFNTASGQSNFYNVDEIQNVSISFKASNWRYILDSLRYNGEELLPADLNINGKVYKQAGVRYRDARSFTPGGRRNGLFVQLSTVDKNLTYEGVKALDLSSALRDPSMVREVAGYEIARDYMIAPQANYAKVNINDEYYGLFVNVEVVDATFVENHFGPNAKGLFYSDPNAGEKETDGCQSKYFGTLRHDNNADCFDQNFVKIFGNWSDLYMLTDVLNNKKENIAGLLDVDQTLWMLAFNNVLLNLYSYTGKGSPNYYLVKNAKDRFVPVLGDMNLAFGSFKNTGVGSDLTTLELMNLDPLLHVDSQMKPLISSLLANEENKKLYFSHCRAIIEDHLDKSLFRKRVKDLQKFIFTDLVNDRNRYYSTGDFSKSIDATIGKRSRIPGVANIMEDRVTFLKSNPNFTILPPAIGDVTLSGREKFSQKRVTDFRIQAVLDQYTKKVFLYYRFNEKDEWKMVEMADDGKSDDGVANDHIYGVVISPKNGVDGIEFYIKAENAKALSFSPQNYTRELHSSSLSELNQ